MKQSDDINNKSSVDITLQELMEFFVGQNNTIDLAMSVPSFVN